MDLIQKRLDVMSERINELEEYINEIGRVNHDKVKDASLRITSIEHKINGIEKNRILNKKKITSDSWVIQLENGEIINKFDNANHAAKCTGIQASSIYKCLRGTNKKAGGYQWEIKPFENGLQNTSRRN